MQQKKKLGHICSVMRDAENRTRGKLLDGHAWLHVKKYVYLLEGLFICEPGRIHVPKSHKGGGPLWVQTYKR